MAFQDDIQTFSDAAILAPASERSAFIKKTYLHLFGAIMAFTVVEVLLFTSGIAEQIAMPMLGAWPLVLGGFVVAGFVFRGMAAYAQTKPMQYLALAGYVVVQAIIFAPMLYIANEYADGVISSAALTTLLGFTALTGIVFITKKDFSFLGSIVKWGGIMALITIVVAMIGGFQLGNFFSCLMVALAGASILWETSAIQRNYPTDRYVSASLGLFASVALMFWYILQLFLSMSSND